MKSIEREIWEELYVRGFYLVISNVADMWNLRGKFWVNLWGSFWGNLGVNLSGVIQEHLKEVL